MITLSFLQAFTVLMLYLIYRQRNLDQTVAQVDENTKSLESMLERHKVALENLPTNLSETFSKEVQDGLNPVVNGLRNLEENMIRDFKERADELQSLHKQFEILISNVSGLDDMPEWLNRIEKSISPLQIVSEQIMNLQTDNEAIIKSANLLIKDYSEKGDKVHEEYGHLKNVIDEWTQQERISRDTFSETVDDHLKNLNGLNAQMNEMMGSMKEFADSIKGVFKELESNIPKAADALTEASRGHKEIERKLNLSVETMNEFSRNIANETKSAITNQATLQESMNTFLRKFSDKLESKPGWKFW